MPWFGVWRREGAVDSYRVQTVDGWQLAVRRMGHRGERRGAALLLPAMMVDARTMDKPAGAGLASTLADAGFDVHLADFRGHGASVPTAADGAVWSYDDLVFRDVPALVEAVRDRDPGTLWVVGHSLGAHVSLAAAAAGAHTFAPDGHILLAGNIWMPSLEGSRRRTLRKAVTMRLFRRVAGAFGRWPSRLVRMGPADEAWPYVQDLTRFWFEDTWGSRDGRYDYLTALPEVQGPVLSVCGAGDRLMAHAEGARAFAERLGPGRADFWFVRRGAYGVDWDPDHMGLVTDPRSGPLHTAIADYMSGRGG